MARHWAVVNQKGGVGKTTTAISLAAALAIHRRVLLVDTDPQGNATSGVGVVRRVGEPDTYRVLTGDATALDAIIPTAIGNLDLIPATIDLASADLALYELPDRERILRKALDSVSHRYDYIIIDAPPSLGLLTINVLAAADEVIIPMQCEYFALEGISQLLEILKRIRSGINPDLSIARVILTMFDGRTNHANQILSEVRSFFGDKVSNTVVPRNIKLSEAPSYGQPITVYDPRSKGAVAYTEIAKELLTHAEGRDAIIDTEEGVGSRTGRATAWWRKRPGS
jgi:chromosome partitioning protein